MATDSVIPPNERREIAKSITARVKGDPIQQYNRALTGAVEAQELIQPTADEARNGWDAESLTRYITEQNAVQSLRIDPSGFMRRTKPQRATSNLKWRRGMKWGRHK